MNQIPNELVQQIEQTLSNSGIQESRLVEPLKAVFERCSKEHSDFLPLIREIETYNESHFQIGMDELSGTASYHVINGQLGQKPKRNDKYYSAVSTSMFNVAAAALTSYTVPAQEYSVKYKIKGIRLEETQYPDEVKNTLDTAGNIVCDMFLSRDTNVHDNLYTMYKDYIKYGICAVQDIFIDDKYYMMPMNFRHFIFDVDKLTNKVNIIFHKRAPTYRDQFKVEYDVWVDNPIRYPGLDIPEDMIQQMGGFLPPCLYLRTDSDFKILSTQILEFMPIRIPRFFSIPGYKYGFGYGQELLNETKLLQEYMAKKQQLTLAALDPPLLVNRSLDEFTHVQDGMDEKTFLKKLMEGDTFFTNSIDMGAGTNQPFIMPIRTQDYQEVQTAGELIPTIIETIKDVMMLQQYMLPETPNMTAKEVAVRADQKLQMLTPVITGALHECVEPAIANITKVIMRNPQIQAILAPYNLQLIIDQKTKFNELHDKIEANNLLESLQAIMMAAQIDQTVLDNFDIHAMTRRIAASLGTNQKFIRAMEQVAEIQEQRAKAQKEAQEMQQSGAMLESLTEGNKRAKNQ